MPDVLQAGFGVCCVGYSCFQTTVCIPLILCEPEFLHASHKAFTAQWVFFPSHFEWSFYCLLYMALCWDMSYTASLLSLHFTGYGLAYLCSIIPYILLYHFPFPYFSRMSTLCQQCEMGFLKTSCFSVGKRPAQSFVYGVWASASTPALVVATERVQILYKIKIKSYPYDILLGILGIHVLLVFATVVWPKVQSQKLTVPVLTVVRSHPAKEGYSRQSFTMLIAQ